MKKKFSAAFGMFSTAVVLLISIFAMILQGGSLAWFASSETVTANGITLAVETPGVSAVLHSYPITKIDYENNVYHIDISKEMYELPMEDKNGISYSEYKKALAIIIDITANEPKNINVSLYADTTGVVYTADNFISNCLSVTTSTLDTAAKTAVYHGTTQSFVTVSGSTCSKVNSLSLETISVDSTATVCYIIEYNNAFLNHISEYSLNNHLNLFRIYYSNDIRFVVAPQE